MSTTPSSSRQKLIRAALTLFVQQGIRDTTTKQIAKQADVNEVTLFRQFGNKNGLLLAVLEEGEVFQRLSQMLVHQTERASAGTTDCSDVLRNYAVTFLQALEQVPELIRSIVGEAGRVSAEHRLALDHGLTQANQYAAELFEQYFLGYADGDNDATLLRKEDGSDVSSSLPAERLVPIIHSLLLGYTIMKLTTNDDQQWSTSSQFIEDMVNLLCPPQVFNLPSTPHSSQQVQATPAIMLDLPASLIHDILQLAKKSHLQDYAMLYILCASGITPEELIGLERSNHISDRNQHLLQITKGKPRQVPISQRIMGKRYGTYQNNPLTQWLKKRKDNHPALFIKLSPQQGQQSNGEDSLTGSSKGNSGDNSTVVTNQLTLADLQSMWKKLTADLSMLSGAPVQLEQLQRTWCTDLLMRGVTPENMQILTGWSLEQLNPYIQRAKEKAAIEQVMQLDKQ